MKDGVSHPRQATVFVETLEAERLEMSMRSARYVQPKMLVFDGAVWIRVTWRIGQTHDQIATTAGRGCDVSSVCSVRRKKQDAEYYNFVYPGGLATT